MHSRAAKWFKNICPEYTLFPHGFHKVDIFFSECCDIGRNLRNEIRRLKIGTLGRALCVDEVELTPREYDLLCHLAENRSIVLTRDNILNAVWEYDYFREAHSEICNCSLTT